MNHGLEVVLAQVSNESVQLAVALQLLEHLETKLLPCYEVLSLFAVPVHVLSGHIETIEAQNKTHYLKDFLSFRLSLVSFKRLCVFEHVLSVELEAEFVLELLASHLYLGKTLQT